MLGGLATLGDDWVSSSMRAGEVISFATLGDDAACCSAALGVCTLGDDAACCSAALGGSVHFVLGGTSGGACSEMIFVSSSVIICRSSVLVAAIGATGAAENGCVSACLISFKRERISLRSE